MDSFPQRLQNTTRFEALVPGISFRTLPKPQTGHLSHLGFVIILPHSFWEFNCFSPPFSGLPDYYTFPQVRIQGIQLSTSGSIAITWEKMPKLF